MLVGLVLCVWFSARWRVNWHSSRTFFEFKADALSYRRIGDYAGTIYKPRPAGESEDVSTTYGGSEIDFMLLFI